MSLRERVTTAAETILTGEPDGLTIEALARQVAQDVGRRMPPGQVAEALRGMPRRFVEGTDGRWRLRSVEDSFTVSTPDTPAAPAAPAPDLRRGCYVVFDLEATGQHATAPATEIIQVAAQRWIDGQPQEMWASFARPAVDISAQVARLTQITMDDLRDAPPVDAVLRDFFAYVGDLPLIAHNGSSYDGPLLRATCDRLGMALPASFRVLDTLPLARALLPTAESHRVESLAEYFGCARPGAHRADVDVAMLGDILQGLQRELQRDPTGAAVFDLLQRSGDDWAAILEPPAHTPDLTEITACFGAQITPLLPERSAADPGLTEPAALDAAFDRAEAMARPRRPAQVELAQHAPQTGHREAEAASSVSTPTRYRSPPECRTESRGG